MKKHLMTQSFRKIRRVLVVTFCLLVVFTFAVEAKQTSVKATFVPHVDEEGVESPTGFNDGKFMLNGRQGTVKFMMRGLDVQDETLGAFRVSLTVNGEKKDVVFPFIATVPGEGNGVGQPIKVKLSALLTAGDDMSTGEKLILSSGAIISFLGAEVWVDLGEEGEAPDEGMAPEDSETPEALEELGMVKVAVVGMIYDPTNEEMGDANDSEGEEDDTGNPGKGKGKNKGKGNNTLDIPADIPIDFEE